jgi:hypothetical protein
MGIGCVVAVLVENWFLFFFGHSGFSTAQVGVIYSTI